LVTPHLGVKLWFEKKKEERFGFQIQSKQSVGRKTAWNGKEKGEGAGRSRKEERKRIFDWFRAEKDASSEQGERGSSRWEARVCQGNKKRRLKPAGARGIKKQINEEGDLVPRGEIKCSCRRAEGRGRPEKAGRKGADSLTT